jgi:hypothetical protein
VKLNLLVLRTPRLEDLRRFYSALGARFESERHGNGPEHYAATLSDDLVLELYPTLDGAAPDPGLRLGLSVDDIGETLRLPQRGRHRGDAALARSERNAAADAMGTARSRPRP